MTHFHEGDQREPAYDTESELAYRCSVCKGIFRRRQRRPRKAEQEVISKAINANPRE